MLAGNLASSTGLLLSPDGVSEVPRTFPRHSQRPARDTQRIWSSTMAQVCDVCGKGPQFGNNISHAHNVTRRRWNVNLQKVKALVNGAPRSLRVCTSCIKSGKITKA